MAISLDKTPFKVGNKTANREVWRQAISFHPFFLQEFIQVFYYEYDMVDGQEVEGSRRDKKYIIQNTPAVMNGEEVVAPAFNEFDYWADFNLATFIRGLDPSVTSVSIAQLLNGKIRLQLSKFPVGLEDGHIMTDADNN